MIELLVALVPLSIGAGPLLMLAGWLALRWVHAGDGQRRGRPVAVAALALGTFGTAIGVLGFVAVVLQNFRAKADRLQCADNLRQIGIAVQLFYDDSNARPELRHFPRGAMPEAELPVEQRLSWFVQVLPHLRGGTDSGARAKSTYAQVRAARPWGPVEDADVARLRVRTFICPAQPGDWPRAQPGFTSYVGFAGIDPDAARLPVTDPRAGLFGYERVVHRDNLAAGVSYTLLAIETTEDNGSWLTATRATLRGIDPAATDYVGFGRAFGGCHTGIANSLRVDGSVEAVSVAVSARVFRSLVTLSEDELE